ncbi:tetratricopeptide repeat protein [Magnetococcus sp. PR-3]|uniref:tetratricopeptide repeat protein n=1 Tax=Magnetococcus sp. PR-3 TaxID=3120355 RepID=UPI002FCDF412
MATFAHPWHQTVVLTLLLLMALAAEIGLGWLRLVRQESLPLMLLGHAAVVSTLLLVTLFIQRRGWDSRVLSMATLTTLFLGPAALLASLLQLILVIRFTRTATPFESWYRALFPEENQGAQHTLHLELLRTDPAAMRSESGLTAFNDIFAFGSMDQKRNAIALILRHYHPSFAPLLKNALRDENNAIRVQAASAISHIDKGMANQSIKLDEALRKEPDHAPHQLALARHYDAYAYSDLLDAKESAQMRQKALDWYQRYLEQVPQNLKVIESVIRVLIRQQRYEDALHYLREHQQKWGDNSRMVLWYLESLYHVGDYQSLRHYCQQHGQKLLEDEGLLEESRSALTLWLKGTDPQTGALP